MEGLAERGAAAPRGWPNFEAPIAIPYSALTGYLLRDKFGYTARQGR